MTNKLNAKKQSIDYITGHLPNQTRFDQPKFKEENLELYTKYQAQSSYNKLTVKLLELPEGVK